MGNKPTHKLIRKKPDWHSPRISGSWVVFPKHLSKTKSQPKGIIYHREANDKNLHMSQEDWIKLPIWRYRK